MPHLWGTTLRNLILDPVTWTLCADIERLYEGVSTYHEVSFQQIDELRFRRDVPLPWNYAELSEMYIAGEEGDWTVHVELWADPDGFVVHCAKVDVRDVP